MLIFTACPIDLNRFTKPIVFADQIKDKSIKELFNEFLFFDANCRIWKESGKRGD